jgi:hypothetical protein
MAALWSMAVMALIAFTPSLISAALMERKRSNAMCDCQIPEDAFEVGVKISFDYSGVRHEGTIEEIGKHGYWVKSITGGAYGTFSILCPFGEAKAVDA